MILPARASRADRRSQPVLEVVRPGLLTTVQDAGRPGHGHEGVPIAGGADPIALAVANVLAGNDAGAAALECTLLGPELRVLRAVRVALAGADLGARMLPLGRPFRPGTAAWLGPGDSIAFEPPEAGDPPGCRAYLAVRGGIDVPVVLGSRSTSLVGAFGGFEGRALRSGDVLRSPVDAASGQSEHARAWPADLRLPRPGDPVRVLPAPVLGGRGAEAAAAAAVAALTAGSWRVSPASDRRGVRLEGDRLPPLGPADGGSHGVIPGTIQVTPSGQPLVLLADAGTTGGYPVVAVVIAADLGLVAQARPGDSLVFQPTDPVSARRATADVRRTLAAAVGRLEGDEPRAAAAAGPA